MKSVPFATKASDRGERFRRRVVRERRGLIRVGERRFRRALQAQYDAFVRRAVEGRAHTPAALEAAQSLPVPTGAVREDLTRFYMEAATRFGEIGLSHLKGVARVAVTKQEDAFRRRMQEYLERVGAEKVTQISETTRQDLVQLLQEAIEEGLGIDRTSERISDALSTITRRRATIISRTEIIPASNAAVSAGARETGLALDKEWISAQDNRVRRIPRDDFDHLDADGQIVDMDEPFIVTGEELMFPGDTSRGASAGNVIQCRCAHAPIPKDR